MTLAYRVLAAAQLRAFRERGFLVLPNVLTGREVDLFLSPWAADERREQANQPLVQHKTEPLWNGLVRHVRTAGIIAELLRGRPSVVQSMTAFKKAAAPGEIPRNGVALHQDQLYIRTDPDGLVGCWIALNDTGAGNGGFSIVPGSHRDGLLAESGRDNTSSHSYELAQRMRDRSGREWIETIHTSPIAGIDPEIVVTLEIPKGSAVFFDGFLVHGSRANAATDRERLAVALHYVKAGTWVYRVDLNDTYDIRRAVPRLKAQPARASAS